MCYRASLPSDRRIPQQSLSRLPRAWQAASVFWSQHRHVTLLLRTLISNTPMPATGRHERQHRLADECGGRDNRRPGCRAPPHEGAAGHARPTSSSLSC